jgi:hypothetical protein
MHSAPGISYAEAEIEEYVSFTRVEVNFGQFV